MTDEEWAQTVETVITTARAGYRCWPAPGNNTAHVIKLSKIAKELGADAQLCVTPITTIKPDGLIAHYHAITDATDLPIIIYNVPSRTGLNLQPDTLALLSKHENIIGVKEASADMIRLGDMMRLTEGRVDFYSGSDEVIIPLMSLGGLGVISVVSNVAPALTSRMTTLMLEGRLKEAAELQLKLFPLIHALFAEVNPIPAKAGMNLLGHCDNHLRLPLVPLSTKNHAVLETEMRKLELIP